MTYEIDHDVPIPKGGQGRRNPYPIDDMDIGDSFFVPETDAKRGSVQATCAKHAARLSMKMTTRAVDGGTRVWRIA